MTSPSKRKGDKAELDLARELHNLTGWNVRRKLGAGRSDDVGDLDGIPLTVAEVKDYADTRDAIAAALADLEREQANAGAPFGVAFVKRRRAREHRWIAVMTLSQWAALTREATS